MIGRRISHYEILEKLGEGGMGVVYRAHDLKLDRTVALKFLPHGLTSNESERARFLQEAKAAAALNHPNACSVIDIQDAGGEQFIILEFVEGETLKGMIRRGPLPLDAILDIVSQVAEGLGAAHEKGVVHRDVKSDNIMVTKSGQVKIMDFGLAKLKNDPGLTKNGTTVGTTAYMSPEQIQGMDVDQRTDLWALGVVLYEAIANRLPFRGEHEAAVMYEVLNVDPPPLRSLRPDTPDHLQELVSRLLQRDPARRPGAAGEVIQMLKQPAGSAAPEAKERSIAVLYFTNLSSEQESDYFCAGITEDIITDLSKIKELKVVPRNDVQPFRNKELNTRQVGESLRVNYLLEGSVRKSGNRIRITSQLTDVKSGFHVWAERYDRLVEDIFDVQDELSQSIVRALKISLTESEQKSLRKNPTDDIRAYDLYMRGRELLYKRGKKNTVSAIQLLDNAVALDPKFVRAYAALAEAYSFMFSFYDGDAVWLEKTIAVSEKVLGLEPDSIEAMFGLATVYFHQKRFEEAASMYEQVTLKNPEYYDAFRWSGILADLAGDYDAALRHYERCAALKPNSEEPWMHSEMTYRRKGDAERADMARRKVIELGLRKLEVNPDDAIVMSRMVGPYVQLGESEKAAAMLKRIFELDPNDGLVLYNCACLYGLMGKKKEALACLENAIGKGYKNVVEWVKNDPDFESLRGDHDFQILLERMR